MNSDPIRLKRSCTDTCGDFHRELCKEIGMYQCPCHCHHTEPTEDDAKAINDGLDALYKTPEEKPYTRQEIDQKIELNDSYSLTRTTEDRQEEREWRKALLDELSRFENDRKELLAALSGLRKKFL